MSDELQDFTKIPQNLEAERALLGTLIDCNHCHNFIEMIGEVWDCLEYKHFFAPLHGRIFNALGNGAVGVQGLASLFQDDADFAKADGEQYLKDLVDARFVVVSDLDKAISVIYDAYLRRCLMEIGRDIKQEAEARIANGDDDIEAVRILEKAEQRLKALCSGTVH